MTREPKRGTEEIGGAIGCLALLVGFAIFVWMTARGCGPPVLR